MIHAYNKTIHEQQKYCCRNISTGMNRCLNTLLNERANYKRTCLKGFKFCKKNVFLLHFDIFLRAPITSLVSLSPLCTAVAESLGILKTRNLFTHSARGREVQEQGGSIMNAIP